MSETLIKGPALVLGPEEGESYWQPGPHHGHMTVKLGPHNLDHKPFSMGIQVMPPGCHVRAHGHARNDEVFYILEGTGSCVIDGQKHVLEPGSTVMLGRYCEHSIHNDGDKDMKDKLGGKGANLAEMSKAGVPVPPGFTIVTDVCNIFFDNEQVVPAEVDKQIWDAVSRVEKLTGKKLGDASDPLLLSVRSGAKFSMPGMMNTILNLGLNDATTEGLAEKTGNARFAYDCYRRFIQMFGEVSMNVEMEYFDEAFDERKKKAKVKSDADLSAKDLKAIVEEYKKIIRKHAKRCLLYTSDAADE